MPCLHCAEPVPAGAPAIAARPRSVCGACLADPPPWERLHALWSYAPPVRELVHAWKFRRLDYLGVEPARELAAAVRRDREVAGVPPPDRIVPLPLAWTRRLARGFNPTEIVADELARALGRPWSRALRRELDFGHQALRRREARRLHAGRFSRHPLRPVAGLRILLVDDVLTTGETARAATRVLRDAGAAAVDVAVLARTLRTAGAGAQGFVPTPAPAPV